MNSLAGWAEVYIWSWLKPPKTIEIIDIIQILLLTWIVYKLIMWLKNTRAYALMKGILFILAFVLIANILQMEVIVWLLSNIGMAAITAVVIIFQPELRKVLEQMGHSNFFRSIFFSSRSMDQDNNRRFSDHTINEIVKACFEMGDVKTGALIVVQRETNLTEFEQTGIPVDGVVTSQLLINIFEHNTPLHDGAVVIRDDRVAAATCYLPLSDNMELSKKLGTRHRAGVGVSEISDALAIMVSEEAGHVSYALNGRLHLAASPSDLRNVLQEVQVIYPDKLKLIKGGQKKRD